MIDKLRITPQAQADVIALTGIDRARAHSWINIHVRKAVRVSSNAYQYENFLFYTERPGERTKIVRVRRVNVAQDTETRALETADNEGNVAIDGITIRKHAIDRAVERFGVPRERAAQWIYDRFRESNVVVENIRSLTNEGHVYATKGIAIGVDTDRKTIRTVYYSTKKFPPIISDKVRDVVAKEMRKLERKISAINKTLPLQKAALEYERAERVLALVSTRSLAKKMALQARINALDTHLNEINAELASLVEQKKHVATALIAI
ncbi:hypothetical protein [Brevibacillus brevis]|uniref:hypothetical protein n=1 Tax=Brevibacillus brevis TaxID=1393 RepID=UPI00165D46FB|nr:hypothetical protein [Brevibacillus brevis]